MSLDRALSHILNGGMGHHLKSLQRGLEKESLRVMPEGKLAQTPHPAALGSPLAHASITTDYSESLLEFVTPIHRSVDTLLGELNDIHHFTYLNLADEKLWVNSMPCVVEGEEHIPIARYGSTNVALMKEAYRRGLGHRYGRLMQTIAGIHFNFSMPNAFWDDYFDNDDSSSRNNSKSSAYFALTRNFLRHSWLVCYLFGASPAVCKTFLRGRQHSLSNHDAGSFYSPHATSLRLSNLGYSNDAQSSIELNFNSIDGYTGSLREAIQRPHPPYQEIPLVVDGKYQQLNPNLLQIENEFYGVIRPKQVAKSGESPSCALIERGVEYVEIRSLDLNPFVPIGIDDECVRFFDLFLLFCLFSDDSDISRSEIDQAVENRNRVVMQGRDPGLVLSIGDSEKSLAQAANHLLDRITDIAGMMDDIYGHDLYSQSLATQRARVADADRTPSARILRLMDSEYDSFFDFAMDMATRHEQFFKQQTMDPDTLARYHQQAEQSLQRQQELEAEPQIPFDEFLADYFRRQNGS